MLNVKNLTIYFAEGDPVVDNLSFRLEEGEILGVVGESGSGKSLTALSIAGLLPDEAHVSGRIELNGVDLNALSESERRKYKGKEIAMVFQEPMTSLNPVYKIHRQLDEMLRLHTKLNRQERMEKILTALTEAELPNPEDICRRYPHELSGGMQQRVMIAMAILLRPRLIIADEPTTALDAQVQTQILKLLQKINRETGTSILLISHDLSVVREICEHVIVMQDGICVEAGRIRDAFDRPHHEYTKRLISSIVEGTKTIEPNANKPVLELKNLSVYYKEKTNSPFRRNIRHEILRDFSLTIKKGEIVGIVGKSGSGKTTLSNTIMGLHKDFEGEIIHYSSLPQMVFQDVHSSLNPAKKIGWILEEPLRIKKRLADEERKKRVLDVLERVGLSAEYAERYPHELSGGQRQRASIALALMLRPAFIIADEPVSALDVTMQSQILELLLQLQKEMRLAILFISHDKSVVDKICDRIISI